MTMVSNKKIYLDYAASTPIDPRVLRAMEPYFTEKFGNPGSLHSYGQEAMAAVDKSRETIAKAIGAEFGEIVFTSGATEANNLALRGAVQYAMRMSRIPCECREARGSHSYHSHIFGDSHRLRLIISAVEHESVLETARDLERDGAEIVILPVKKNGVVDIAKLPSLLDERTVLVSVMYANNETGVIQPIEKIAKIIEAFRVERLAFSEQGKIHRDQSNSLLYPNPYTLYPLLHTDAAQAFQFLDIHPAMLGVDLMTLSAHKIYGPKGIGALYINSRVQGKGYRGQKKNSEINNSSDLYPNSYTLTPILTGGGQEFGMRSGTENVPLIIGFAKATELISSSRESWNKKIEALRDYFERGVKKIVPRAEVHGANAPRLSHIANIYFPNHTAEDMLTFLDLHGVAISAGSACRARSLESSPVLLATGYSKDHAARSVRVSFGRQTTTKEIDRALAIIKNIKASLVARRIK